MTPDSPTPMPTLIDRLRYAAEGELEADQYSEGTVSVLLEAADALTQARAELERRAEPVAWRHKAGIHWSRWNDGQPSELCKREFENIQYAYAAPPVSAGDAAGVCMRVSVSAIALSNPDQFKAGYRAGADACAAAIRGQAALAWRDGGK